MKHKIYSRLEYSWLIPLILALTAILLFGLSLDDRKKEDINSRGLKNLEEIAEAQMSLHTRILKSRLFYLNHFDGIAQDQKQLLKAIFVLQSIGAEAQDIPFEANLKELHFLVLEQDKVIEDFKTSLSVYKNSEEYIGFIVGEFLRQNGASLKEEFLLEFSHFQNRLSSFRSRPDLEQQTILKAHLEDIERNAPKFSSKDRNEFRQILDHSGLILKQVEKIDGYLAKILNRDLDRLVELIQQNLLQDQSAIRISLKRYEQALYSIIVVLTFYAFFILIRLKLSNDRLELRVIERTHELGIATQKAIDADAAKSTFLAHMSHEIRTPLNGVTGITAILLKRDLPVQEKELVNAISFCGRSLLTLINDILDLSKIEAKKLTLDIAPFSMVEVIEESLAIVSMNADNDNVSLSKEISSNLPPLIAGDRDRVAQILLNLLSNSIKFSRNGKVTIKLDAKSSEDKKLEIILSVIDNGIGIEEHLLKDLFQEFSQAHSSSPSKFGGTGLGLAISKKLAKLMGGEITVKSQYGIGSTFSFVFETREVEKPLTETIETKPVQLLSEIYLHRILIVDDNFINRKVAGELLSSLGYAPDIAKDGLEALDYLNRKEYDIVFTDLRMPNMDGYELVQRTRSLIKKPLRFVAMTASATVEEKERCMLHGIMYFISKPIKEDDFIQILSIPL